MSVDLELLSKVNELFSKRAYAAPASAMTPEAAAPPPPIDPAAAGGMPMPPPGGMPPPPGGMPDPAMMGGMPPIDPAMMGGMPPPPGGMPMPPPIDPAMMGMMPPPPGMMPPPMPPEAAMEEEVVEEEEDNAEESEVDSRLGVMEDMIAGLYSAMGIPLPEGSEGEGLAPTEEVPAGVPEGLPPIPGMLGDASAEMVPDAMSAKVAASNGMSVPPTFDLASGLKMANIKRNADVKQQEKVANMREQLNLLRKYT